MGKYLSFVVFHVLLLTSIQSKAQIQACFVYDENGNVEFQCYNNHVSYDYYGYPVGSVISNYAFYVNGIGPYTGGYAWSYQSTVVIGPNSVTFVKGDKIDLYVNGGYVTSWICNIEKPSLVKNIYNWMMNNKPEHIKAKLPSSWKKEFLN